LLLCLCCDGIRGNWIKFEREAMKLELITVAMSWAIGAGIGQLVLMPFGLANAGVWFGMICGATAQSMIYFFRNESPFKKHHR